MGAFLHLYAPQAVLPMIAGEYGVGAADAYVARQNGHQGRPRWIRIDDPADIPDRPDGTPAIFPHECRISIAGFQSFSCAQALEVAGALAHAASGTRRIAGRAIATPVEAEVDLEVDDDSGRVRSWRFTRRDARLLSSRMAMLAVSCLPLVDGAKQ
jgi:hypothetical protein